QAKSCDFLAFLQIYFSDFAGVVAKSGYNIDVADVKNSFFTKASTTHCASKRSFAQWVVYSKGKMHFYGRNQRLPRAESLP
ncbi:MAG: hypothetical protein RR379_11775, partial [Clostridia bacterium]